MTANQIAAESVRIDKRNSDINASNLEREKLRDERNYEISTEVNRINADLFAETKRHNERLEQLQVSAQDLERRKLDIDEQYKQTVNEIQREYNTKWLEIQSTQGEEKLRLEEEANQIQERKNQFQYHIDLERNKLTEESQKLQAEVNMITSMQQQEVERANKAKEKLEAGRQEIQLKELETKERLFNKQLSYDQQRDLLDRQLRINDLNAHIYSWQNQNLMSLRGQTVDVAKLLLQKDMYYKTGVLVDSSNIVKNILGAGSQVLGSGIGAFKLFDLAQ